jgi:hypothetical protein
MSSLSNANHKQHVTVRFSYVVATEFVRKGTWDQILVVFFVCLVQQQRFLSTL